MFLCGLNALIASRFGHLPIECNVKMLASSRERAECVSMCRGPAGELVLRPLLPVEPLSPWRRLFTWQVGPQWGAGDGHIREGETAGVKATFRPEVMSGGSWVVGVSESRFSMVNCFCSVCSQKFYNQYKPVGYNTIWLSTSYHWNTFSPLCYLTGFKTVSFCCVQGQIVLKIMSIQTQNSVLKYFFFF